MTKDSDAWRTAVNDRISHTLDLTAESIAPAGGSVHELMDVIRAAAHGGKRLRAALVIASHAAHRGNSHDRAVDIAAAIELFQTAALIHDDVLDDSDTRRGQPAAHRALAAAHAARHGDTTARAFGAAGGILAGDIALMACHRALASALVGLAPSTATTVSSLFASMAELVTAGQYLDMRIATDEMSRISDQEDDIRATMRSKTASYSAEFPLALGAAIAGAHPDQIATIRAVGLPLGVAFQLRDDILGLVGKPHVTGKPAGDDVREGKRTLILWRAWNAANSTQRQALASIVGDRNASEQDVATVVDIMRATGAIAKTETELRETANAARRALADLPLAPEGAQVLTRLFDAAVTREA